MPRIIALATFLPLLLISCFAGRKATSDTTCLLDDHEPTAAWLRVEPGKDLGLRPQGRQTLPLKYQVFQVDPERLSRVLKDAQSVAQRIRLPLSSGCRAFEVSNSGTLSPELAAKYPNMVSLKGQATDDAQYAVRIDSSDGNLKVEINESGQIFFLESWQGRKGTYYLLYQKEDVSYPKQPFESPKN